MGRAGTGGQERSVATLGTCSALLQALVSAGGSAHGAKPGPGRANTTSTPRSLHVLPASSIQPSPGQGAAECPLTDCDLVQRVHKGAKSLLPAIQTLGSLTLPSHLSGYCNSGEKLCLKHQTPNSAEMSKQINKLA